MISVEDIMKAIDSVDCGINASEIAPSKPLSDVGIDSLDFFNVVLEIQSISGREIPDEDLDALKSIDDFVKYFSSISLCIFYKCAGL